MRGFFVLAFLVLRRTARNQASISWFVGWMAIAILVNLIQVALGTMRRREISGFCQAPLNLAQAFRLNMIGTFFNQTQPSTIGGDAVRLWLVTRTGASCRFATYSVLVDRVSMRWSFELIRDDHARAALDWSMSPRCRRDWPFWSSVAIAGCDARGRSLQRAQRVANSATDVEYAGAGRD